MIPTRITILLAITAWSAQAWAGETLREPRYVAGDVQMQITKLRAEIAALDAQARGDSPEFEAELREWEGKMAEPPEWSAHRRPKPPIPEKIVRILQIEPSERSDAQRTTLAQYFRPQSKIVAAARKTAAAKRVELAALRRAVR